MNTKEQNLQDRLRKTRYGGKYSSDRAFAEAVGVKESTMYKWLKGTPVWPDEPNLRLIADYYGISIDQLTNEASGQPAKKVKESSTGYKVTKKEAVASEILENWPMPEQLSLAQRILSKAQEAIAV